MGAASRTGEAGERLLENSPSQAANQGLGDNQRKWKTIFPNFHLNIPSSYHEKGRLYVLV
jgi:hypothetical protein